MIYEHSLYPPEKYSYAYVFLSGTQVDARKRRMEDFLRGARFEKLLEGFKENSKSFTGWRGKVEQVIAFAEKMEKAGNGRDFHFYVHSKINGQETPRVMEKVSLHKLKKYREELEKPAST